MLRLLLMGALWLISAGAVTQLQAATPVASAEQITPDHIGEFVTVTGTINEFRSPRRERQPYSFKVTDASGSAIRVMAWPDIMETVNGWQTLAQAGTTVTLTAEVRDYNDRLELQIQDGTEVYINGVRTGATVAGLTTSTLQTTPSAPMARPVDSP